MSHIGSLIQADANGGIDVRGDIATVLGYNSGDVWSLFNYAGVRMFSRKKPVDWNGALDPQTAHPNDWWKGINGDYGIVSKSASVSTILPFLDGGLNGWTYSRDLISARVLDFNGYSHAAYNPFDDLYIGADRSSVAPGGTLTFQYQYSDCASATQLGLIELYAYTPNRGGKMLIADMYIGIIIYKEQSGGGFSYYDWLSSSESLADLETDPAMHSFSYTVPSEEGTYMFVPVLTTNKKESSSQAIGDIVTIPGTTETVFTVAATAVPYMQLDAFVYNSGTSQSPSYGNKLYFYCDFFGGATGGQFDNINIVFETSGGVGYLTLTNVQNGGASGSLSVPADSSVRKPAESGDVYSTNWTSQALTLENFIRSQGGRARIYCATAGTTLVPYTITVREAAGMPGGSVIPF